MTDQLAETINRVVAALNLASQYDMSAVSFGEGRGEQTLSFLDIMDLADAASRLRASEAATAAAVEALQSIHDITDAEIGIRFRLSSHKTEAEMGANSLVYSLLVMPRNIARAALPTPSSGGE